ncbi:MAG: O-methyltransferase [Thermoplasmata archaeon]|nr:O-methyltransferase [Thermoplasmata archaeon]
MDRYLESELGRPDPAFRQTLASSARAGLPGIQVSPLQGRFLHVMARLVRARRILEIGTLGGYSAAWLGRALPPGGRLITLEIDPLHAAVARSNLRRAGLSRAVEVRVGPALESLARLAREGQEPFDLIFIDADKENGAAYLEWAERLAQTGSLILVDNVVRQGSILRPASGDTKGAGTRRLLRRLGADRRLTSTVVQWVGEKGHDGIAVAVVEERLRPRAKRLATLQGQPRSARASSSSRAGPG